jgi:hypothetical protein
LVRIVWPLILRKRRVPVGPGFDREAAHDGPCFRAGSAHPWSQPAGCASQAARRFGVVGSVHRV